MQLNHTLARKLVTNLVMGLITTSTLIVVSQVFGFGVVPSEFSLGLSDRVERLARSFDGEGGKSAAKIRVISLPMVRDSDGPHISRKALARHISQLDAAQVSIILIDSNIGANTNADSDLGLALKNLKHANAIIPLQLQSRRGGACTGRTDPQNGDHRDQDQVEAPAISRESGFDRVWYGSPEVEVDVDGVSRSLCLYSTAWYLSDPENEPKRVVVPSVAVLARTILSRHEKPKNFGNGSVLSTDKLPRGLIAENDVGLDGSAFSPRRFKFVASPTSPLHQKRQSPLLGNGITAFPASALLSREPDLSDLNGAIVVIGSSEPGSADVILTPLGSMPGLIAIANAVAAVQNDNYLENGGFSLAGLATELILVVVGTVTFVLVSEGVGSGLFTVLRYAANLTRASRRFAPAAKYIIAGTGIVVGSIAVITVLMALNVWLAVNSFLKGAPIDLGVVILGIYSDQIIQIGSKIERAVSTSVDTIFGSRTSP